MCIFWSHLSKDSLKCDPRPESHFGVLAWLGFPGPERILYEGTLWYNGTL